MAFVIVQHLAPDHKSILADLIKRYTRMQVLEVEDGMEVLANHTYIIPPNRDMALINGNLQLLEPVAARGSRMAIDFFFRSLALDQHEHAICIVLSGTGSDGTMGVRTIKGVGGMVMAQTPETTTYDGMPRSAIATGLVDYILPPAEMMPLLIDFVTRALRAPGIATPVAEISSEDTLKKICILLRDQVGHDFSQYKHTTLIRRIERRMAVHQLEDTNHYLRLLRQTPGEAQALFRDLLIGVTNFFRDPEAFAVLESHAIPSLFADKPPGMPVRVWVCGCATGEEAYSIAILLQEYLEGLRQTVNIQIFATDIDSKAIDFARAGVYPASISIDISAERLARFFVHQQDSGTYRIRKNIRDLLVFSKQDVIQDPPFSKLDLISCRNLLIYLNADLQKKLLPLFHFSLNPKGFLFLGTSETVGDFTSLFASLDRKHKLYRHKPDGPEVSHPRRPHSFLYPNVQPTGVPNLPRQPASPDLTNFRQLVEKSLLAHYAEAGVLINDRGQICHFYGRTGKYLEPAGGDPTMNILAMAREGLRPALTSALYRVVKNAEAVVIPRLRVRTNGDFTTINLILRPVENDEGTAIADLYLVIFEEVAQPDTPQEKAATSEGADSTEDKQRITTLLHELQTKDEYLQSTLEEMETANEELKSTNEEMQSVNEELQSTNEELETSKEELQSVNEELATVNAELQNKVSDLSTANNDMNNLLAGTGVATIFVNHRLQILRFTPSATEMINLIPGDIGRPFADIVSNLVDYTRLVDDIAKVLSDLSSREIEVQSKTGDWFLMRIRPYRTLDNVIEGAVITFSNITELYHARAAAQEARLLAENIVMTISQPLLVLSSDFSVVSANHAFYATFQTEEKRTIGENFFQIDNRRWDTPALQRLLKELLPEKTMIEDFMLTQEPGSTGRRSLRLNARSIEPVKGQVKYILLAIEDVSQEDM